METKTCKKCGETKEVSDFPILTGRKGIRYRRGVCKKCFGASPGRRASVKRYDAKNAYRYDAKKYLKNREKILARHSLQEAVRDGRIVRPARCPHCGEESPVEGHHENYSRRLDVVWACKKCHDRIHGER